jgi:hypothetical protein
MSVARHTRLGVPTHHQVVLRDHDRRETLQVQPLPESVAGGNLAKFHQRRLQGRHHVVGALPACDQKRNWRSVRRLDDPEACSQIGIVTLRQIERIGIERPRQVRTSADVLIA